MYSKSFRYVCILLSHKLDIDKRAQMKQILTEISRVKSFAGPSRNFSSSWVSGILYKFHAMTGTLMFLLSCFVYVRELLGEHIHCIADVADASGQTVS